MIIPIRDTFEVTRDGKMHWLRQALDPDKMQGYFEECLSSLSNGFKSVELNAIRVRRYKPERRCLIEYDVRIPGNQAGCKTITLLGKVRAKGLDLTTYQVLQSLWQNGFDDTCQDGISVAEPVGLIPELQMWLQRKMPGVVATELLDSPQGITLSSRIAEAAHKLHQADVKANRFHTISDEMDILRDRLARVRQSKPCWEKRLSQIWNECDCLAAALPQPTPRGIHRDFYPDQVLVDGDRLYLIDFDLYCQGDPALDIGNFIGHITEYSLRTLGNPSMRNDREQALEDRFVELAGEEARERVRVYSLLTLARHIFLSTQFPDRQASTEAIMSLCEKRLRRPKMIEEKGGDQPPPK